jgi:DNA-binding PadR family transcriptional regulator
LRRRRATFESKSLSLSRSSWLEADGLIKAEWRPSENNRRARYCSLTRAAEKRLAQEVQRSREHTNAVAYLGCKSELRVALNDRMGIEPEDV